MIVKWWLSECAQGGYLVRGTPAEGGRGDEVGGESALLATVAQCRPNTGQRRGSLGLRPKYSPPQEAVALGLAPCKGRQL